MAEAIRAAGALAREASHFRRGDRGLYHGVKTSFGNNVSHSERKTRRSWVVNSQRVTLWSDILESRIKVRVSTTALRAITRAGGFDNYILHTTRKQIKSELGDAFRVELERVLDARKAAGLPPTWIAARPAFRTEDATAILSAAPESTEPRA